MSLLHVLYHCHAKFPFRYMCLCKCIKAEYQCCSHWPCIPLERKYYHVPSKRIYLNNDNFRGSITVERTFMPEQVIGFWFTLIPGKAFIWNIVITIYMPKHISVYLCPTIYCMCLPLCNHVHLSLEVGSRNRIHFVFFVTKCHNYTIFQRQHTSQCNPHGDDKRHFRAPQHIRRHAKWNSSTTSSEENNYTYYYKQILLASHMGHVGKTTSGTHMFKQCVVRWPHLTRPWHDVY